MMQRRAFFAVVGAAAAATAATTPASAHTSWGTADVTTFGATGDGVTDDAPAIQAAINSVVAAGAGEVFFPIGRYLVNSRLKLQNTYAGSQQIKLRGVVAANAYLAGAPASAKGSVIVGNTGGIVLDMAGACNVTLEDFAILSSSGASPSTIGILFQRTSVAPFCQNNKFVRLAIGMASNPSANGGVGSVAIMNKRGEHHHHYDCWYYADRPVIQNGDSAYPSVISPDYSETVIQGATLGLNYFDNVAFLPVTGACIEFRSVVNNHVRGGYMRLAAGQYCVRLDRFNDHVSVEFVQIEPAGATGGFGFVKANATVYCLRLSATTSIANLIGLATVNQATVKGYHIELGPEFGQAFNYAAFGGGPISGGTLMFNSQNGCTIPNSGIYNSVIMDASLASHGGARFSP